MKIIKICQTCGKEYKIRFSHSVNSKYCSRECMDKNKDRREKLSNIAKKIKHLPQQGFQKGHKINIGIKRSQETKEKMAIAKMGNNHWDNIKSIASQFKKGQTPWNKGKKCPQTSGKNNGNWKGGISPEDKIIRRSIEYRLWRESVFARDNWTCQKCEKRGSIEIHPHHIKNFAEFSELRFAIDNGITFCKECHMEFHKIYGKKNNKKEQLIEFLLTT